MRSAVSTPVIARAERNANIPAASNGERTGRSTARRMSEDAVAVVPTPGPVAGLVPSAVPVVDGARCRRRARSSLGVALKTVRTVSLNWRTELKPAAKATSAKERSVSVASVRAVCARWARASDRGPAPSSALRRRVRCRGVNPSALASSGTPARSTAPSSMSRMARAATSWRRFQAGVPGTASGRQRRHARNPSSCAAAAVRRKTTFCGLGVSAGQEGRQ